MFDAWRTRDKANFYVLLQVAHRKNMSLEQLMVYLRVDLDRGIQHKHQRKHQSVARKTDKPCPSCEKGRMKYCNLLKAYQCKCGYSQLPELI